MIFLRLPSILHKRVVVLLNEDEFGVDFPSPPAKQVQQIHIQSEVNTQRQCFKASSDKQNKRTQIKIAYHCGVSTIIAIAFTEAEAEEKEANTDRKTIYPLRY